MNIITKTPLQYCSRLSEKYGANIFLKREDNQIIRSFKIRGVLNKIINNLSHDATYITASAGNHAQGVAHICNKLDLNSNIYVPENTPLQKIDRIRYFGNSNCKLTVIGRDFNQCLNHATDFCNTQENSLFIHPYDDIDVIKGQGHIANEILSDIILDILMVPIGGGGLLAGILSKINKSDIYGVEPEGAASMYESIRQNKIICLDKIDTFVDGASVAKVGNLPFNIISKSKKNGILKDIFKISNNHLSNELIDLYQNEGIIAEPAGALSICGLSYLDKESIANKNIVCVISGGNNDIMRYPEIIERSLKYKNLKHYFIITFKQQPGELKKYVKNILTPNSDITRFEYIKKNNKNAGSVLIGIELYKSEDISIIKNNMISNNFNFIQLDENNLLYNYLV